MKVHEEHLDVLQNIEFAVTQVFRRHPELQDYVVLRTYEALCRAYSAEAKGRRSPPDPVTGTEAELLQGVWAVCEERLGRAASTAAPANFPETTPPDAGVVGTCEGQEAAVAENLPAFTPLDPATMVRCLRHLIKSVELWTAQGGAQGYLNYMTQFIA